MRLHLDKNMKVYEMSFERYVEEIKELVENEVGTSIQIEQITTTKNNGTEKAGLMMSEQKSNLKPVIYLNEMYERQKGNGKYTGRCRNRISGLLRKDTKRED